MANDADADTRIRINPWRCSSRWNEERLRRRKKGNSTSLANTVGSRMWKDEAVGVDWEGRVVGDDEDDDEDDDDDDDEEEEEEEDAEASLALSSSSQHKTASPAPSIPVPVPAPACILACASARDSASKSLTGKGTRGPPA